MTDMLRLMNFYLKHEDRDYVATILKQEKPNVSQLMYWLHPNIPINTLAFIDSHVKYSWSTDYLYELCAYAINGNKFTALNYPRKWIKNVD